MTGSAQQDWLSESQEKPTDYFVRQFERPYRSTIAFHRWLKAKGLFSGRIADLACGMGAPLAYIASQEPHCQLVGIDFNPLLVKAGNEKLSGLSNVRLELGDIYNLSPEYVNQFDGLLSLQTLSWLESYEKPLEQMAKINPKWMAISSLFYDGPVNATIQIQDYSKPTGGKRYKDAFYNVYSLPLLRDFLRGLGYLHFDFVPFEIDCDLEQPQDKGMATYTEKLENGKRLQLSGPLLMNWYFVFCAR